MFIRKLVAASAAAAVAPVVGAAAPAVACGGCDDASITVRVSDSTPSSGAQFVARGLFVMGGLPAPGHMVRVQTMRTGSWTPLTGAHVVTNDAGRYRVRLVLSQRGPRLLRVVGVGEGREPTQFKRFTVRVR